MDNKPIALFDMDGTLCDYQGQLRRDMIALMSSEEKEYYNLFDDEKPWLKARMDLIKSKPGWWRKLPRLQLGWDIFSVTQALGFEIEILTKGPRGNRRAWKEKCEWIDDHFGAAESNDDIYWCRKADHEISVNIVGKDKSRYYGHILCDDFPPYILGWLEHRPRGLGIMISNEHNIKCEHPNLIHYNGTNLEVVIQHLKAVMARKPGERWQQYL